MNGRLLNYKRWGTLNRAPVLLLHGFLGSQLDWQPIIRHLHEFDFLTIDLPGHGRHPEIGQDFSFDDTADAIITILDKEKISTCPMLGYSMGGRVALFTAVKYPQRFSHLILESASPGIDTETQRQARLVFEQQTIDNLERLSLPDFIDEWYNMRLFDSLRSHPDFTQLCAQRQFNNAAALISAIKNLGSGAMPSLWEALSALDVPVFFIYGELDPTYATIAEGILRRGKNVSLYTIKKSGHNTHFENPAEFSTVVKNILKSEE